MSHLLIRFALIVCVCVGTFVLVGRAYADSIDIPIDQYINFSADDPGTPHQQVYKTGMWNGVSNYLLFKSSQSALPPSVPSGSQINWYQLKVSDPTQSTGVDFFTSAAIWLYCTDPTQHTYADIASCGIYPQDQFSVSQTGTTLKVFDYGISDTFNHWILFTGQSSGLQIDPAKMWWHVDYTPPTPTPTPLPIPGDANGDRHVNETDYAVWLSHYDQTVTGGAADGDFNNDTKVTGADFIIWLSNNGT